MLTFPKAFVVSLITVALLGCASAVPDRPVTTVEPAATPSLRLRANTRVLEAAPILLAARDYFPGGIAVELGGIPNLVEASAIPGVFDAGPADVATHAETQALRYSIDHPDIRIILTVTEGHYRIVARRSAGIDSLADLAGKRIGTIPSTSAEYFLHRMLETVGLSTSEVTVSREPVDTMAETLASGDIDAVAIWEPYADRAAKAIADDAIMFSDPATYREMFNLNTTADRLADPVARAELVRLVRAIINATEAIREDPARAQTLSARASGFDREEVLGSWSHLSFPASIPADLIDVLVAEEAWLAQSSGRSPRSRAMLETLIDRSIYREAMNSPE